MVTMLQQVIQTISKLLFFENHENQIQKQTPYDVFSKRCCDFYKTKSLMVLISLINIE
jgi:hypothetical protein